MLVLKKISTKKLAIYLAVILFMLVGAGFMLYQNKKLTARPPVSANLSAALNYAPAAPAAAPKNDVPGIVGVNNQAAAPPNQNLDISGGLDLNIFSSDKFKNLRENALLIKEPVEVGKRDPFKPN